MIRSPNQGKRGRNALDTPTLLPSAALAAIAPRFSQAQTGTIRIGVLNDQSGPYRDGPTGVICAKQALLDFGASARGFNVEVLSADHQNKPDVGASIARQWIDQQGVDVIADVPTSSVGLAVSTVCREKNRIMLNSGTGTSDLTGPQCSPNTIHWTYDTYMLGKSTGGSIVKEGGSVRRVSKQSDDASVPCCSHQTRFNSRCQQGSDRLPTM